MAKTETGWTKEYPSLKYGSWFWLRDAPDAEPELRQLTGGRNWMEAFGAVRDSTEFLGPVTAADFEQLTRLREAAKAALPYIREVRGYTPSKQRRANADKVIRRIKDAIGKETK